MRKIFILTLSFFLIISCKTQEKENPKTLGEKNQIFYLDRFSFNENKDVLLSNVEYVIGNINDKLILYNISTPENIVLNIDNTGVAFDYMQFWVNKKTDKFIFLELEAEADEDKIQEVIKSLNQSFKMIDLTDKERLKEDISDKNTFFYHKNYLYKSSNVYAYLETIEFKDKKEKDRIRLNFYSYPYDKILIELNKISVKIINQ
ncbi:hypothetical protein [Bergeyella zoohelcum]|uniref:Lipoprotein n=1 Tax=Bergeyella zoohelcum TaxID=1015 RepID=A0A376C0J9_9FLAO|nr:hypothetical protein [Bergeyella zoohelcum]EKB57719.1 hypothetical protein HMPREF9700_02129 [Bergeyella zoohelcum CCUG 30536]SSZ55733.1 Uncharacterised protein [Bergeyella zoohelcum]